jgi:hypothetical protein
MAYATSNPPTLMTQNIGNVAPAIWTYTSADAAATIDASGYITNGGALGMKVGDLVIARDTATPLTTSHYVVTVSATYPGAVDLSNGVTIGNATSNSD